MTEQYYDRQQAQLNKFLAWKKAEGGMEGPTHPRTLFSPRQVTRMNWLKKHAIGTVLEVGCNSGMVLAWVSHSPTVAPSGHVGVDINPQNIELAQALSPEFHFQAGDARALPFLNGSFDTVMVPETLEHLGLDTEVPNAILEAFRVTRNQVLFTFPDGSWDTEDACCFKHQWLGDDHTIEKIIRLIQRYGHCTKEVVEGFICIRGIKQ